jgi:hypothetical protein
MTPADVEKCPECGSTDKGTRYQIAPPTEGNPLGTYCTHAWHHVPEVQRDDEFTPLEFQVIFGLYLGGEKILQHLGLSEDLIMHARMSIYNKLGTGGSGLIEFARDALNNELRRRNSQK